MTSYGREDLRQVSFSNLSNLCDEAIIHELCTQFGPVYNIHQRARQNSAGTGLEREHYCRVTFYCLEDAKYCYQALSRYPVRLFDRELRVSHGSSEARRALSTVGSSRRLALHEVGAKIEVTNVDNAATEFELAQFFRGFGELAVPPRMKRDGAGRPRGVVVVSYKNFNASDAAIEALNGYRFRERPLAAAYAPLEDGSGRLHGSAEERANAAIIREQERLYDQRVAAELAQAQRRQRQQGLANPPPASAALPGAAGSTPASGGGGGGDAPSWADKNAVV